jgi:hypothetical protein
VRQASLYEKILFEAIKELDNKFYYSSLNRIIEEEQFKIEIEKRKEEMVGQATVVFVQGEKKDYEIRYNRITNLNDGYSLLVPGINKG